MNRVDSTGRVPEPGKKPHPLSALITKISQFVKELFARLASNRSRPNPPRLLLDNPESQILFLENTLEEIKSPRSPNGNPPPVLPPQIEFPQSNKKTNDLRPSSEKTGLVDPPPNPLAQLEEQLTAGIRKEQLTSIDNDGSCLFHAARQGLEKALNPKVESFQQLRENIIAKERELLQSRDEGFLAVFEGSLMDYKERLKRDLADLKTSNQLSAEETNSLLTRNSLSESLKLNALDQLLPGQEKISEQIEKMKATITALEDPTSEKAINLYFEQISKPDAFGSRAETYALSKLYPNVAFYTIRPISEEEPYTLNEHDPTYNKGSHLAVVLAYNGKNHFDLFIPT